MAAIHRVDVAAVGLADHGRPGNYFERQLLRWGAHVEYVATAHGTVALFRRSYEPAFEGGQASYRGYFDLWATPAYSPGEEEAETMIGTSGLSALGDGTVYLGSAGLSTTEAEVEVVANRAGTASLLWLVTSVAPGVGGSFTYTLRKNGIDTAVTCTIAGGSQRVNGSGASPTVSFDQGDRLSIKLVAAGAARAFHNWSLKYL